MSIITSNTMQGKDPSGVGLSFGINSTLTDYNQINCANLILGAPTGSFVASIAANTWYLVHDGQGTPYYHGVGLTLNKRSMVVWNASMSFTTTGSGVTLMTRANIKNGALATSPSFWTSQSTKQNYTNYFYVQINHNGMKVLDPGTYYLAFEFSCDSTTSAAASSGYWNSNIMVFPAVV